MVVYILNKLFIYIGNKYCFENKCKNAFITLKSMADSMIFEKLYYQTFLEYPSYIYTYAIISLSGYYKTPHLIHYVLIVIM